MMRSERQIRFFLLIVVLQASCCLLAQQSWSIAGSALTYHGETPDRPILITLQFRGSTIATTFCDSEGKFTFSELSPNLYHVLVTDEKFQPVDQSVEINPLISSPAFVRLSLVPKQSPRQENPAAGNNPNLVGAAGLKQFPKPALKEFDKGVKADKDGRIDEAIGHYQKAVKLAPDLYIARNNLGSAYLGKSQFVAAREQFEEVIKINPSDAAAYFNMGNLLMLTQKSEEATHWVDEGLSREPNSAFGHFLLGSLCARTGKAERAEKELRVSLQFDPHMPQAYLQLVNLYLQQGRKSDAISQLDSYLKAFPDAPFSPKARDLLKRLQENASRSRQ